MAEKPTVAFVLSIVGGIIILINGAFYVIAAAIMATAITTIGRSIIPLIPAFRAILFTLMALGLIFGIVVILGAALMYTTKPSRVRAGSILVLIFSILSIIIGGGFIVGLVLGVVGGALGLTWKPSTSPVQSPSDLEAQTL